MFRMLSLILALAVFPVGMHILNNQLSPSRKVASQGGLSSIGLQDDTFDLSESTPEEFRKAFKYQVLKNVELIQLHEGPGLKLGLFLIKNSSGAKVFVCDQYPTMDLFFMAEGVAISGEVPKMILRVPCIVSDDQKHIAAFPVPLQQIFASPISQSEFNVSASDLRESGKIFLRNGADFWPTEWVWTGVKFYGRDPTDILEINSYEVLSVLGEPLSLPLPTE